MTCCTAFILAIAAAPFAAPLCAQGGQAASPATVIRPAASVSTENYRGATVNMIKSRAKALAGATAASGTKYFAVTSAELSGKSPAQTMQLLNPPALTPSDFVRKVEVLVDLPHPLTLFTKPGEIVDIGTVTIPAANRRPIVVESKVWVNLLKVVAKE